MFRVKSSRATENHQNEEDSVLSIYSQPQTAPNILRPGVDFNPATGQVLVTAQQCLATSLLINNVNNPDFWNDITTEKDTSTESELSSNREVIAAIVEEFNRLRPPLKLPVEAEGQTLPTRRVRKPIIIPAADTIYATVNKRYKKRKNEKNEFHFVSKASLTSTKSAQEPVIYSSVKKVLRKTNSATPLRRTSSLGHQFDPAGSPTEETNQEFLEWVPPRPVEAEYALAGVMAEAEENQADNEEQIYEEVQGELPKRESGYSSNMQSPTDLIPQQYLHTIPDLKEPETSREDLQWVALKDPEDILPPGAPDMREKKSDKTSSSERCSREIPTRTSAHSDVSRGQSSSGSGTGHCDQGNPDRNFNNPTYGKVL